MGFGLRGSASCLSDQGMELGPVSKQLKYAK